MRTRQRRSIGKVRNLVSWAMVFSILLPALAFADGPAAKETDDKTAASQGQAKPADKPDAKPADKPAAAKPDPEPAEPKPKPPVAKPEAKSAEPKPKPADNKPAAAKPNPAEPKPAENKPTQDKAPAEKPEAKPAPTKEAPKPKPAPAPEKPINWDLALMGEFVGTVSTRPNRFQQIGLQIRAAGGDSFEAAQFLGGLPTRRPPAAPPIRLIGKRFEDTLVLSGGPWAVLVDSDRCLLVDRDGKKVGRLDRIERKSPTLGAKPPKGAIVLFDGSSTEQFSNGRMTEDGLLMEGADTKPMFQDFNLHLEFKLPLMPAERGQGRANSGIYLQSRYEVQVLDSFAIERLNNGCGALYTFRKPDVNMCLPPLVWQTYDIVFTAPRWNADGTKRVNARITVWHNGVKVHNNLELPNKTGAGKIEEPTLLPIRFQNHGDPVRFRNIWLIDRGASPPGKFLPASSIVEP